MNKVISFLIFLFFILMPGMPLQPVNAAEQKIFPDIQRILKRGVLRVAILGKDAAPLIMTKPDGQLYGTEPDLARDLAQKLGVKVKFIRSADTYDEVVKVVASKKADIAVSYLTGDVRRGLYVLFSQPYIKQSGRLFYNRAQYAKLQRDYNIEDLQSINDLPGASNLVVGVEAGSVNKLYMERDFPNLQIKTFRNLEEIMSAVKSGSIFAGMYGSLRTRYYLLSNPALAIHVAIDSTVRVTSNIRIAVRPDSPNLLRWINLYLSNHVGKVTAKEIIKRYLKAK